MFPMSLKVILNVSGRIIHCVYSVGCIQNKLVLDMDSLWAIQSVLENSTSGQQKLRNYAQWMDCWHSNSKFKHATCCLAQRVLLYKKRLIILFYCCCSKMFLKKCIYISGASELWQQHKLWMKKLWSLNAIMSWINFDYNAADII